MFSMYSLINTKEVNLQQPKMNAVKKRCSSGLTEPS